MKLRIGGVVVGFLLLVLSLAAQTSGTASSQVPPLIPFSSVASDEGGSSLSGTVNITFSLYSAQQGGTALWTETQNNVQLDPTTIPCNWASPSPTACPQLCSLRAKPAGWAFESLSRGSNRACCCSACPMH